MKTAAQTNAELTRVAKLIDNIPIAMLTTLDDDGALVSRPMTALEMDAQGALWFLTDVRYSKVDHLRAVNLSFTDRDQGAYVSLSGHGEIDNDRARIHSLWSVFAKPWFPEGPDSSNLALLKFIPDRADYWDGPSSKMVRVFGTIASVIAGKPVALGAHGSLTALSASTQAPASALRP
ncbi:MAG: general stress protein 26 [Rhodoferax sp.]|jgi:general stress protein 26